MNRSFYMPDDLGFKRSSHLHLSKFSACYKSTANQPQALVQFQFCGTGTGCDTI